MECAADFVLLQMLLESIPLRMADDVEVISALDAVRFARELKRSVFEQFVVPMPDAPAFPGPGIKMLQLDSEDGALDSFHSIVEAHLVVVIALCRAVLAEGARAGRESG